MSVSSEDIGNFKQIAHFLSKVLPIPSDYLPEGIEYPVEKLSEGIK
jgi:hypothetical protein